MNSLLDTFERFHEIIKPDYAKKKEKVKNEVQLWGVKATAALVFSLAMGILGFTLTASGGLAAILGVPLILISLPVCYFSFNAYKICQNLIDVIDNPKKFVSLNPGLQSDNIKAKNHLKRGTFCFDFFIDSYL